ncbi:MAG: MoaD/ThiS family protein [Candidatus Thorarchaeota archaeon]
MSDTPHTKIQEVIITTHKTVAELLQELDISEDHVVLVNGKQMQMDFQLKENDKVVILPKIAGG